MHTLFNKTLKRYVYEAVYKNSSIVITFSMILQLKNNTFYKLKPSYETFFLRPFNYGYFLFGGMW